MQGVRALQAQRTRAELVRAASALFVERGYDKTSVDDIIAAAGSSKGAVYHQFKDKREIFEECFRVSQERVIGAVEGQVPASLAPWERAQMAIQLFLESYVTDRSARTLLAAAAGVLGATRAHEVDGEVSAPFIGSLLADLEGSGPSLNFDLVVRILLAAICEAATSIADADEPHVLAVDAMQILGAFAGGLQLAAAGDPA